MKNKLRRLTMLKDGQGLNRDKVKRIDKVKS